MTLVPNLSNRPARTLPRMMVFVVAMLGVACPMATSAQAQFGLVMEPKVDRVPCKDGDWPLTWFLAAPGQVFSYAVGYPRAPIHDVVNIHNDTDLTITGFALHIVGTAIETEDVNGEELIIIDRTAKTEAVFGDVDGDRRITSNMFKRVTVSSDGKFILFTDGKIEPGDCFTDISLSTLLRGKLKNTDRLELVGVDSSIIAEGKFGAGDVNGDKVVDQLDYNLALRLARGELDPTPCELAAGDFNNSGRFEMSDVQAIQRLIKPLGSKKP